MRLLHGRLMVAKDNPGSRFCIFTVFQEAMHAVKENTCQPTTKLTSK